MAINGIACFESSADGAQPLSIDSQKISYPQSTEIHSAKSSLCKGIEQRDMHDVQFNGALVRLKVIGFPIIVR
jgi:hypothetical protein